MPAPNANVFGDRTEFRVTFDPDLSKGKKGKLQCKFFTSSITSAIKEGIPVGGSGPSNGDSLKPNTDPRDASSNKKRYVKRVPYQGLPVPRLAFDKDWVAAKPSTQILVTELSPLTTRGAVKSAFEAYGAIAECELILNPHTAMSLGSCLVRFGDSISKAHQAAKAATLGHVKVDMKSVKVEFDEDGAKARLLVSKVPAAKLPQPNAVKKEPPKRDRKEKLPRVPDRPADWDRNHPENNDKAQGVQRERERERERKSHPMSPAVARIVSNRPYIFVSDRHVPTNNVSPSDIKRFLRKFSWERIVCDDFGFYVIFASPRDARRCFDEMDGRRLFEYRLVMKLMGCVTQPVTSNANNTHDKTLSHAPVRSSDPVTGATKLIIEELKTLLLKDIRERVIVPRIFEGLKISQKHADEKKTNGTISGVDTPVTEATTPISRSATPKPTKSIRAPKVITDSVTGLDVTQIRLPKFKRKNARPMTHRLNFAEEEEDEEEEGEDEREAEVEQERVGKQQKAIPKKERKIKNLDWSSDEEEEEETGVVKDEDIDMDQATVKEEEEEKTKLLEKSPTPQVGNADWRPFVGPEPQNVCNETIEADAEIDFVDLKKMVMDDEDLHFLKAALPTPKTSMDSSTRESLASHLVKMHSEIRRQHKQIDALVGSDTMLGSMMTAKWDATPHSRKSQGYYYVPEAAKFEYMPHRRRIQQRQTSHNQPQTGSAAGAAAAVTAMVKSSRMNRVNNRRFAAELNLQKQMSSTETDVFNFNQLKKRKKPVKFARSAIHNWGLYAVEPIAANEMIIEYVGEMIRAPLADLRERNYQRAGIGSSYLFRIDDTVVVDATKKGGIARFINHCCTPSCTAKIIKVEGEKRIVIYALRNIGANEELTYDYKFERELGEERIPCLCGSPACKGFLN